MDFSNTPQEETRQAYETLARLYIKYCGEPGETVEGTTTMMRSGLDICALESILMQTGTHIFCAREKAETQYLEQVRENANLLKNMDRNNTILGMTPEHKGSLKKKYTLLEIQSMQEASLRRHKAAFIGADNDCQDFEMACLSLPEGENKTNKVMFLEDHHDDADDIKTERYIGQIVMTVLHAKSPYVEKTIEDAINIKTAELIYDL